MICMFFYMLCSLQKLSHPFNTTGTLYNHLGLGLDIGDIV